jgi:hypothetical protein
MVDSTSTLTEVEASYDDNSDYRDSSSATKARAFAKACRILVRRYMSGVTADGTSVSRNVDLIKGELADVENWLDGNDTARTGESTVILDFREARQ